MQKFGTMPTEEQWQAIMNSDKSYDGKFYLAVKTTKIFCRPSCTCRKPKRENVLICTNPVDAQVAGFRPCKRCRPDLVFYEPEKETALQVKQLLDILFCDEQRIAKDVKNMGLSQNYFIKVFGKYYGKTPKQYVTSLKVSRAVELLNSTDMNVNEIAFACGFESMSSFYKAFKSLNSDAPSALRGKKTS